MTDYNYLYDQTYYGDKLTRKSLKEKTLHWQVIHNGIVLPHTDADGEICGGIVNECKEYIDGSGLHRGLGHAYDFSTEDIVECREDVVFLGLWPAVWGHCLTDNIRRLWVLDDPDFMEKYGNLTFVFIPLYLEPDSNFRELLHVIGADQVKLKAVNNICRFRNIILPDECFWREEDGTRVFTGEYMSLIDKVRDYGMAHFSETGDKKLYFTYRKFPAYRTIGERKLERFFSKMGYRIISPEEYTFSEQLNMLAGCEEFASTVGSAAHNIIFLRDRTKVFLIPRADFITEYQLALDQIHDLDITYIDSSLSLYVSRERSWEGPFYYIVSNNLYKCFNQNRVYRGNRFDFLVYRHLAFALTGVSTASGYYRKVYSEYLFMSPDWTGCRSWLVKLLKKRRVRKWITALLG